jgi:uncharacterized protein YndB with AHSA1/START domain
MQDGSARSSVTAWVPLPPQQVFDYISDFSRHHEWAMDEIRITPVSPGHVKLGSTFRSVGKQAGKEWPSSLEVTAFEPPRSFEFTATGGPLDAPIDQPHRHEFILAPQDGGTRLELRRTDPKPPTWPAWLFRLFGDPIVRLSMGRRIETVERLRLQLERLAK